MCGGRHNLPSQIIGHHDEEATDRATVISALLTGQYFAPVRVVAFNTTKRRHGLPIVTIIVTFIVTSSVGRFPRPLFALHPFGYKHIHRYPTAPEALRDRWATSSECIADSTASPSALSISIRSLPVEM